MPITYACDHCGHTSTDTKGWLMVSVQFMHDQADAPFPPGGRTLDSTLPDFLFDTVECRDTWIAAKGLSLSG